MIRISQPARSRFDDTLYRVRLRLVGRLFWLKRIWWGLGQCFEQPWGWLELLQVSSGFSGGEG